MYSKDFLEEITGRWRRSRDGAGHGSTASPSHFALRIRFRFDIRRSV
jgi:hypothetical protein